MLGVTISEARLDELLAASMRATQRVVVVGDGTVGSRGGFGKKQEDGVADRLRVFRC